MIMTEGHTVRRYDGELNNLHMKLLEMSGLVLDQLKLSLQALKHKDLMLAHKVLERENTVDTLKTDTDEEVISVLARRCPVASDLRIIMSFSKAITDLERVGDEAARIAQIASNIYDNDRSDPSVHLMRNVNTMGNMVVGMFKDAVMVFDSLDTRKAEELIRQHSELDGEFQERLRNLATFVLEDARNVGHTVNVTLAIKALERIGDYTKNLAEYVIYLVCGIDVRDQQQM